MGTLMEENSIYNAEGGFLFNPLMDFWELQKIYGEYLLSPTSSDS
jgi:hypothetical protein